MSYESTAEPIKLGYLFDFKLPDGYPEESRLDLVRPFELVFKQGLERGMIDRPVQIVFREVEGLPKGTVKAVIDAYGELVDEGCLAVFGPAITDNCVPTREAIEHRFHVPAISVTGSEEWLGEWTFSLSMGSMTDEPIFWAELLAHGGHTEVGALIEASLVGESYIRNFRTAAAANGIHVAIEERIPQTAQDITDQVRALQQAKVSAFVHCGFGFGLLNVNRVLRELDWDPPRFLGTAFQNAWIHQIMWDAILGWTGLDQYDDVQFRRPAVPRRVRGGLWASSRVLRAGRQPRPGHRAPPRVRRRPAAVTPWGQGGTRAGEDVAGCVRGQRYPPVIRQLDAPGVGGGRLPGGAPARAGVRQRASRRALRGALSRERAGGQP